MTLQRTLYLAARTMADAKAAERGQLPRRLARRQVRRRVTGPLADRLWKGLFR